MITEDVLRRQAGETPRSKLINSVSYKRRLSLDFVHSHTLKSAHTGGVTWLDLDQVEHRYLLAGASDASIAIYDTQQQQLPSVEGSGEVGAVVTLTKHSPDGHKFSVSSVAWYPVDTGLFVSGGYDNHVKVWDANTLAVAANFSLSSRVHAVAMSPAATSHCLVAVGSGDPQVMLCDVASGGFTHTLSGHRAAVWAVHWSLQTEWQLVTGSCDGQLRLWDIRRAGPVHIFDQHQTQQAQQAPPLPPMRGSAGSTAGASSGSSGRGLKRSRGSNGAQRGERADSNGSMLSGGSQHSGIGGRLHSAAGGAGGSRGAGGRSIRNAAGAGVAAGAGAPSERMFLPEKATRYATAHGGSITAVHPTPHGLYWISAGTDDRVRLWDATSYRHLLVNYPGAFNRSLRARQLSISQDSRVLFHPSGSVVQMFDVDGGRLLRVLQGAHFDTVNCCKWNPVNEELYSGSNDCHIVVWAPPKSGTGAGDGEEGEEEACAEQDSDADNWSD